MLLHQRRRARLLIYFGFQQYKSQVFKATIYDLTKQMAFGIQIEQTPNRAISITDDSVT